MEDITNLSVYAEAYYSKQTYEENIQIRRSTYELLQEEIDEIVCYIHDLDGKHSEIEAEIEIQHRTAEELAHNICFLESDGDRLRWKLEEIFENHNLDLNEECEIVRKQIEALDPYEIITVRIRKSQVHKVIELTKNLNQ